MIHFVFSTKCFKQAFENVKIKCISFLIQFIGHISISIFHGKLIKTLGAF